MNTTNTFPSSSETIKRPKYRDMVKAAITTLADKKGSSRQAIMKYIIGTYGVVEDNRTKALVRTALVEGVKNGDLAQTKGTGASGSFKIGKQATVPKPKKPKAKKETKNTPKKESKKAAKKEIKSKTEPKQNMETEEKPKKPKKEKSVKATKSKKPSNVLTPKVTKGKTKAVGNKKAVASKDPQATSPLSAVTKIKAKLLFTSTPSKKKNNKVAKLLTPKRVVVKTKQTVKKSKKKTS